MRLGFGAWGLRFGHLNSNRSELRAPLKDVADGVDVLHIRLLVPSVACEHFGFRAPASTQNMLGVQAAGCRDAECVEHR